MKATTMILAVAVVVGTVLVSHAAADPLPDRDILKFAQAPMSATDIGGEDGTVTTYYGHDELSTLYGTDILTPPYYEGTFMADDFADESSDPVVHVKWWGSYSSGDPQGTAGAGVQRFLISFESDMPAGDPANLDDFSHPDQPLLSQVVT